MTLTKREREAQRTLQMNGIGPTRKQMIMNWLAESGDPEELWKRWESTIYELGWSGCREMREESIAFPRRDGTPSPFVDLLEDSCDHDEHDGHDEVGDPAYRP